MSVELSNESGIELDADQLVRLAAFVLAATHVHPDTELGVMFVDEEAMSRLHEQWMGEPGATDVLSFPMDELRPGRPDAKTPAGLLGDVVICSQVAAVQADAAGHSFADEILLLLTHGMLHLMGFDHATPDEEAEMFGLQREILSSFAATERAR